MKHLVIALWCLLATATCAAAQSGYQVSPGDTLSIEVVEDPQLNRTVLVLPDGTISFPFAGTLQAGGQTISQLQQTITSRIASNFAESPTVFVTVSGVQPQPQPAPAAPVVEPEEETINIFMSGEIGSPGPKEVAPGTTFLQAMALTGGFTQFAATKRVQLRRQDRDGRPRVYTINYRALTDGAVLSREIVLIEGDVILVPERRLFE